DDEFAAGLIRGPFGKATPFAELVREDLVGVGRGDRDRDRANRVMLIGGPLAVQAVPIGLVETLHVVFDPVVAVDHGVPSCESLVCGSKRRPAARRAIHFSFISLKASDASGSRIRSSSRSVSMSIQPAFHGAVAKSSCTSCRSSRRSMQAKHK